MKLNYFAARLILVATAIQFLSFAARGAEGDTWVKKADMPTARGGLACSAANGRIYAMGGENSGTLFATVEEYDPGTDTWAKRADMRSTNPANPIRRTGLATGEVNGRIYAIGGIIFTQTPAPTLPLVLEYTPPVIAPTLHMNLANNAGQSVLRLAWLSNPDYFDLLQSLNQLEANGGTDVESFSGTGAILTKDIPTIDQAAFYRLQRALRRLGIVCLER